jgi:hypothetical protein
LIVVSDGRSLGSDESDKEFTNALLRARKQNVHLIGVGTPHNMDKLFAFTVNYTDTKKSVKKFIDSYMSFIQTQ